MFLSHKKHFYLKIAKLPLSSLGCVQKADDPLMLGVLPPCSQNSPAYIHFLTEEKLVKDMTFSVERKVKCYRRRNDTGDRVGA